MIGYACLQAGMLYGKTGRQAEARRRYEQGCRAGNDGACFLLR
jgi:hypothetical protein